MPIKTLLRLFTLFLTVVSVSPALSSHAAGRGRPDLNLQDGRETTVDYRADRDQIAALRSGAARARALASADFDHSGTPDVVAGYAFNGKGLITLQRGNPDAFAPTDDSVFSRLQQGYDPHSLLSDVDVYSVPVSPDFLLAGNLDKDYGSDVLLAAKGGALYFMAGDGRGGLRTPREIPLPGAVTALAVGEFGTADGFTDIAVGITGSDGHLLLIFDDAAKQFSNALVSQPLTMPASAIEFGGLDDDPFMDVAVTDGDGILVVHGWSRKEDVTTESRVERIAIGQEVRGLAVGEFAWDREGRSEIAALTDDGTVHIVQNAKLDIRPFSEAEAAQRTRGNLRLTGGRRDVESVPSWQAERSAGWAASRRFTASSFSGVSSTAPRPLMRANLAYRETDDLLLMGANQPKLEIVRPMAPSDRALAIAPNDETLSEPSVAGDLARTTLALRSAPVAVLPLPRKLNGVRDLVVLNATSASPLIIPNAPNTTITVDRTDDPSGAGLTAASACTAAANDCSLRGALEFANLAANDNTTISLPANTYILSINGTSPGGCDGNTVGDLGANRTMSIVGAGAATTIIRQTGTGPANDGDRVMCMNEPFTIGLVYSFSGVSFVGGREGTAAGTGAVLGGAGIIGGELNNSLTLTNVVFANNQETVTGSANLGGGGLQITGGNLIITNSTFGGSSGPGAYTDRSSTTTANSQAGSGGGITYTPSSPQHSGGSGTLTITGSTFSRNTASGIGGGGADLLIFAFASPGGIGSGSAAISTSTFSNNQALGTASGGGLIVESLPTTVATTDFTGNSAGNRGGGIFVGGASLLLNGTTPSITFTGNTATSGGSSVSTSAAVNVDGTNTTIGGDIQIGSGATWTNNSGSTLAPTNVVITGGTFNMNNSIMNVAGNLTVDPASIVGGTFNGGTGTVNIQGNFVLNAGGAPATTLNAGTGTFNFNGTGAQSITNGTSITFFNLTDSNITQPLTLNNSLAVNGSLNVNGPNAILSPVAAAVISGTGTLTGTGTARASRIAATPDFLSQYTISNKTLTNLTIDYSGAGNQTVNNTPSYSHLRVSGSGTKTLQGNTAISGNLNIAAATLAGSTFNFSLGGNWTNAAAFTPGTGTVTFAGGTGIQTLTGDTTFFNLTLNNAGAATNFANTTTTVGNDLVASAGTMDGGTSTMVFTGVTDNAGSISGAAAKNFHNLQINSPAVISHNAGANITVEGNYTNAGTFTQDPGLTTIFDVDNAADGAHNLSGAGTTTFGNVTINGSNTVDAGSHNFNLVGANFTSTGTFTGNSSTVAFNGLGAQTIAGDGVKNFGGLLANNANGLSVLNGALPVDASVLGVLTLDTDLTVASGAILQQGGTSAGAADVLGTVRRADLGGTARPFGNLNNTIQINSGSPPQMDFNLAKATPTGFPAGVKVVPRTYTLTPTGGSGISATVRLRYIDAELTGPGVTESRLALWKDTTGGDNWVAQGGTVDAVGNHVTHTGISSFSEWAIAEASDLTLNKSNNVGGNAVVGQAWNWTLTASNTGSPATFTAGQTILSDNLPNSNLNYGTPIVQNATNITGSANVSCSIVSNDLTCVASGGDVTFASNIGPSSFEVVLSATPQAAGSYQNPRTSGGIAQIDPGNVIAESNEGNNSPTANTVTVAKADTTTTITSDNPDPSVVGQPVIVQWTVGVNGPGAVGAPLTGNVTVSDGTDQCVAAVSAGQCDVTFTSAGAKTLTATYPGDGNYNGSASSPATAHTVNKADTTTTITSDNSDPSTPGQSVTVQWTVAVNSPGSGTPTGNVDVTVSGGAETCTAAVSAGQCSVVLNTTGTRTIAATYAGDTNFNTSSDTEGHQVCGTSVVTTNADSGAGSLRQAVAEACDGTVITFDSAGVFSTPQTIALTTGEILIEKNLTINGGISQVTVSGSNASRVFHIDGGNTASIIGLTIAGGSAGDGGAILNDGALTIVNSTLAGNAATADGGAISSTATATSLTLINATISGNTAAGSGGGIIVLGGTALIINSTITENRADSDGNGFGSGGGIRVHAGVVTLKNTIVAGNVNEDGAIDAADDISGTVDSSSSFNLIGTGGAGALTNGVDGNQVGVANAGLAALANNGGTVQTHALLSTSPAIEAGSNGNLPVDMFDVDGDTNTAETLPVDGRGTGFPRTADSADANTTASVDIGAFELHPSIEDIGNQVTAEDIAKVVVFNLGDDTGSLITSVTATSSNTALVPSDAVHLAFTGSGGTRTLTITPNGDANSLADGGPTTITVTVTATNGRIATDTFDLTVTEVNDSPDALNDTLTAINEDSGTRIIPFADLLGNDTKGPANESGQVINVTAVSNPVGGTVQINGPNVEFTPTSDYFGPAGFDYTITDNGTTNGVADPKMDTATASFTIDPVNDPPSFTIAANPPPVNENAGAQTIPSFATNISQGPGESGQTLTFNLSPFASTGTLTFSAGPQIDSSGTLTYTPNNGTSGTATFSVTLSDDGSNVSPNSNTSATQSFTITVSRPVDVAKSFSPTQIAAGGQSTLTITLNNQNATHSLTNIDFVDSYPADLTNVGTFIGNTCGGTVISAAGGNTLQLQNGSLGAGLSCSVSILVTGSTAANHVNSIAAGDVTTDQGANQAPASATLQIQASPTIAKAFSPDTIVSGDTTTLTITLTNSGATDITAVSFTDDLPSDVDVAAIPTTNCGAGVATGTVGTSTVSLANGTIPANSTCTVIATLTSSVSGVHTNTIPALAITSDGGTNAAAATDELTVTSPITVTKAFSVSPIGVNTTSHLTITITNTSSSPAANVLLNDIYPSGLINATPHGASTNCAGGTATATDGGSSLQLTGAATLAPSASCTVEVDVTSATAGSYANTVAAGDVTSSLGSNVDSNTATLAVLDRPTVTKSYSPSEIPPGAPSTLTITISNPNDTPLTGVGFTDTFDANIAAVPFGPAGVCGGAQTTTASSVTLSGATIAASSQCVITVTLTSNVFGSYTNTIAAGDVASTEGSTNTAPASATLRVLMPPTVNSAFASAQIPSGGTSTFTVTLSNSNSVAIVDAALSNTFPTGVVVAGTPATTTTCGGTVTPAGDNLSFTFSGGTIPSVSSCTVSINVTSSTPGNYTNTIAAGAVTTTNAGSNTAQSQAQLEVMAPPTVSKSFSPATFTIGATTDLTITLANGNASSITGVAFTDVYPSGITNAASAPTTNTCGGTVTAAIGGNQLQLSGGTIPAGSCSITIPVTSMTAGAQTNTIAAGDVTSANAPANTQPATGDVVVVAPPTGSKSFAPQSILVTGTSTMTIVIENPNPTQMNDVAFIDNYPAGFVNAPPASPTTSCGGAATALDNGSSLDFSGGTIAANGQCTITVLVRGTLAGNHLNSIAAGGVTTSNFPASAAAISATLAVGVLNPPVVTKSFSPSTIPPNETSTLTITLTNNANAQPINGITFTDAYPSGLTNITPLDASTTCSGGSLTASGGGSSIGLSGASLAANGQCTVTVEVTAAALGNFVNTIPAGAITSDNASPNASSVTAALGVQLLAAPIVTKSFDPPVVEIGAPTTLIITLSNNSDFAITGVDFTDAYPDGMSNTASPNPTNTCGGILTADPGGNSLSLAGGVVPANGTCQVSAIISFATSGSIQNVIPAGAVTSANAIASGSAATAVLQVGTAIPALSPLALLAMAALLAVLTMLIMRR